MLLARHGLLLLMCSQHRAGESGIGCLAGVLGVLISAATQNNLPVRIRVDKTAGRAQMRTNMVR